MLAVNGGVLDLVLNFLCSAKRLGIGGHGRGGDIYRSMLAFAGDDEVERAMVRKIEEEEEEEEEEDENSNMIDEENNVQISLPHWRECRKLSRELFLSCSS